MSVKLTAFEIAFLTFEQRVEYFLARTKEIHGDRYSYENMNYVRNKEKIDITCSIHGTFKQTPHDHLKGKGCPDCGGRRQSNTKEFIEKARKVHGDLYDYSKTTYIKAMNPVEIICKTHGPFMQRGDCHLSGAGCRTCSECEPLDANHFIMRAREVHGDLYDYTDTIYVNCKTKVNIKCKEHGEFMQNVKGHYEGHGCPSCFHRQSKPELKLISLIMDKYPDIEIKSSITPEWLEGKREIDIYIPSKKFAIEYNGDYWHSEKFGRDRAWHERKSNEAKSAGITLLHVWDSRWNSGYRSIYMDIIDKVISGNVEEVRHLIDDNIWIDK